MPTEHFLAKDAVLMVGSIGALLAGRLWLRYQPHDTEINTSWGLGVPS